MPQSNVVVATVDDDRRVRESVQSVLESAGYEAVAFESAETFLLSGALSRVSSSQTCVCPAWTGRSSGAFDRNGVSCRSSSSRHMMTMTFANRRCGDGAVAFLVKPFDGGDLLEHVARATNESTIRAGGTGMAGPLIGNGGFQEVTEAIAMVAPVDSAVLLLGETGTGKEALRERFTTLARAAPAVRGGQPRRDSVGLLESELFGHERGAFTGAVSQTVGRFQAADRGTLFLDEVGDLPLELQPKLLRALQEQQVERLAAAAA